jgi:hypothetical protein
MQLSYSIKNNIMKKLLTVLVLVFGLTTIINAQTVKTLTKSVALNQTQKAYAVLPGEVAVSEWNENFIRVTTTVKVENMSDNIVKRLIMVGRYGLETKEDKSGDMMIIKMPKVAHHVTVQGVELDESYSFEIYCPKGYRIIVKDKLKIDSSADTSL